MLWKSKNIFTISNSWDSSSVCSTCHFMPHPLFFSFLPLVLFSQISYSSLPFQNIFLLCHINIFLTFCNCKRHNQGTQKVKLHSLHMRGTALASMPAPPIQSQLALRLSFLYGVIALCIFPLCWMKAQGQVFHPDISQTSLLQSLNIALPLDLCLSFHLEVEHP